MQELRRQIQQIQLRRDADRTFSIQSAAPAFVSLALGSACFRQERFADAEREYKTAIDADPKAGETHNNLAVVYMLTARFEDADKEIALAEKSDFHVNPGLERNLAALRKRH